MRQFALDPRVAREKELANAQQQIQQLRKEVASLKRKLDTNGSVEKQLETESKLKEQIRQNAELYKEIKSLQRIQVDQGKALEQVNDEREKRQLLEDLKLQRERARESEEKFRREQKTSKS